MFRPQFGTDNKEKRDKWIEDRLRSLPAGIKILDAGAGQLANKKFCAHLDYVSQDFCQYNGQGDSVGLQTQEWDTSKIDIVSDIAHIPEPDASYDAILCSEVLEHVADPAIVLQELARLLKPGGTLILTAPYCSLTHFAPYHFSTGFNRYYYQHHLGELGFEIDELTANGDYFKYLAQEMHRLKSVANRYSGKKPNVFERLAQLLILNACKRFSKSDTGSSELLCFGYHVIATKKNKNVTNKTNDDN